MNSSYYVLAACILLLCAGTQAQAQSEPSDFQPPDDVSFRNATITSEGSRLTADVFTPKAVKEDQLLPTIVMCHGWGGVAKQLRPEAVAFARSGYLVVSFDYRGWGASDGKLVPTKPLIRGKPGEPFSTEVTEIREVVDPLDMATDLQNVVHWVHGEKQCDPKHVGLWGTSYSGGHVVYVAARAIRASRPPSARCRAWTAALS